MYIQPGASKSEVVGLHGERLKVKIKAPPVDGEANKCLIEYMSKVLGISKSQCELIQGETSRQKTLYVDLPPEKVSLLLIS